MLRLGQLTGSGRRQATMATPLVHHVVADGRFFHHAVSKLLRLGVVAGLEPSGAAQTDPVPSFVVNVRVSKMVPKATCAWSYAGRECSSKQQLGLPLPIPTACLVERARYRISSA